MTNDAPRSIDKPEPGYFRLRLVRRGPWVPARIWLDHPTDPLTGGPLDRSVKLLAEIDGKPADIWKVWHWGRPIHVTEYNYLRGVTEWALVHGQDAPEANPGVAVDLNNAPTLF